MTTSIDASSVPPIAHGEAMRITAAENAAFSGLLRRLDPGDWAKPTDCTRWSVRDVVVHLIASAQSQANPLEFVRQVRAGRPLTAEIGGDHWVDGLNEAQLRARADWTPDLLPDLWDRHAAAALKARRRLPAPVRALPLLPMGTALDVRLGWQPLRYLFDMGFTRDVWMHRIDIARAVGVVPDLTADHDGRIIADILAEWSRRHQQPYSLTLTGPAGNTFSAGGTGEHQTVDAVDFARILSGRAEGAGVLRHKLPL